MLKKLLLAAAIAFTPCAVGAQGNQQIGVQWNTNGSGQFQEDWPTTASTGCNNNNSGGVNCFTIPAGTYLRGCTGNMLTKQPGATVLAGILVGNGSGAEFLWVGVNIGVSSTPIQTPPIVQSGPPADPLLGGGSTVWGVYQADPNGAGVTGLLEMQVVCSAW